MRAQMSSTAMKAPRCSPPERKRRFIGWPGTPTGQISLNTVRSSFNGVRKPSSLLVSLAELQARHSSVDH